MDRDGLIKLLQELVRIPSVNPDDTDDPAITGEGRLAEFLATHLERRGFEITWDERTSGRPNVVARFNCGKAERTLLFEAHLDTVSVAGMTRNPFAGDVEGGRLYGRGACDTKGPMAACLAALEEGVLEEIAASRVGLVFVGAMGEEKGNQGAERLVDRGLVEADETIILEPTELAMIHAHKGSLWYALEVHGRATHGSDPAAGVSAILGMRDVLEVLEKEVSGQTERVRHRLLGAPTVNIGKIEGGTAINIVPGRCRVEVDRRTLPGEAHDAILGRVREGLERLQAEERITGFSMHIIQDGAPFETGTNSPALKRLSASCRAHGIEPRWGGTAWYSDAGPFSRVCRDVVVFGPGSILQAHTADEFIDIEQLHEGCEILRGFIRQTMNEFSHA